VGQADLAAGGQGAAGLARLLTEEPTSVSRRQEPLIDLVVVEGADRDQVVEVAGRLPQLPVALADRGGGDPGQLFGERCPCVSTTGTVADGRRRNRVSWPLRRSVFQPLQHHCWDLAGRHFEAPAGDPLVGVAGGVAAGWGDHIATPTAPVHMVQADGSGVARPVGDR
jgi:hypothetical protein